MLHLFLGCGFAPQCKSLIKLTKKRIEVIRRKAMATVKFLKEDIVALLANGLDSNAYGRTEGVLAELTKLSCYDVVEGFCDFLLKHLSLLQKRRDCPEECRQAISSLIFAAAIFSDLPELRYLRDMLCERYGDALKLYVNQEFIRYSSSMSFSMEAKIKLMEDTASDFSIVWDSKSLQQSLSLPTPPLLDQPKVHRSCGVNDEQTIRDKDNEIKQDAENMKGVENGAVGDSTPKDSIDKLLQETKAQKHVLQESTPRTELRKKVELEEEAHRTITYSKKHIPPPYTKPTVAMANGSSGGAEASPRRWQIHEEKQADGVVGYSKKYISPPYSKPSAAKVSSGSHGGGHPKLFHGDETASDKNLQDHSVSGDLHPANASITRRGRTIGSQADSARSSRSMSLPGQQADFTEPASVNFHAASFHTHRLPSSPHVHPKLPNYDDLAAQVAALKGI